MSDVETPDPVETPDREGRPNLAPQEPTEAPDETTPDTRSDPE